ncbi:MAG: DUF4293 family protein [Chitinophagaceae bacterium]|nr:DUF4293 family protein [Chitinophagaceae bacterium]
MIQRIQTLYLFLSLICALLLYLFPIWQTTAESIDGGMQVIGAGTHLLLLPIPVLMAISHLVAIFSFKHRKDRSNFVPAISCCTSFFSWVACS